MLAEKRPGDAVTANEFETRLFIVLRRGRLPLPTKQHPVFVDGGFVGRPDFVYPELQIIIEADSRRWHTGTQWDPDQAKRNFLTARGWIVLNVTWRQLMRRPDRVIADVGAAIRMQGERLGVRIAL